MSAPFLAAPNSVKLEKVMKIIAFFTKCDFALFVHVLELTITRVDVQIWFFSLL